MSDHKTYKETLKPTISGENLCEGQEGHGHGQVEHPVGECSGRIARTPCPQWVYLRVDSPWHGPHTYNIMKYTPTLLYACHF